MFSKKQSYSKLLVLIDILILTAAFFAAALIAQPAHVLLERNYMFILVLLLWLLWGFSTNNNSFYTDFYSKRFSYQFIKIIRSVFVQIVGILFFIFMVKEDLYSRNFITIYGFLTTFLISLRVILFKEFFFSRLKKEANLRKLIIVGTGHTAASFMEILKDDPSLGYKFEGFVVPGREPYDMGKDFKIFCSVSELEPMVKKHDIDEIVIALDGGEKELTEEILKISNRNAVRAHLIPDFFKYLSKKFQVSMFGNYPIVTVRNEPLEEIHWRIVKRAFDIAVSFLSLTLICPWLFTFIAVIHWLTAKGSPFFIQDRIGKDGRLFRCFKFRTMKPGISNVFVSAEEREKMITPFGKFLRKSNLDELPQMINVFLGDMSVVGPRPHAVAFNNDYREFVEEIELRNLVKPGITGWAQVHGLRGDAGDKEENKALIKKRIEYDIWYLENWSFWLDIQIILLTFWQIVAGKLTGK